ncbi:MAG: SpoIID/LytB domain-containing protein [Lachnospiraceae bacterium]
MKKSAGQIAVVLICAFLFPYIVTLFVSGKVDILKNNGLYSGKQVRLEDGTSVMDVEEYLIGIVASQIPAKYNEEAIKAQAVIARTYIYKVLNGQSAIDETSLNVDPLSIVVI